MTARERAVQYATGLTELNNPGGMASADEEVHPTPMQAAALQRGIEALEARHRERGWSLQEVTDFTRKLKEGVAAPEVMPLTAELLKARHVTMGITKFHTDGMQRTAAAYATVASVLALSTGLAQGAPLSYLEIKSWTPVTAEKDYHINSHNGYNPPEMTCSAMAAGYLGFAGAMIPMLDACSWGKPRGECGAREPPPDEVRDLACDLTALAILAAVIDGTFILGCCSTEYVTLLEPRLRAVTELLGMHAKVPCRCSLQEAPRLRICTSPHPAPCTSPHPTHCCARRSH